MIFETESCSLDFIPTEGVVYCENRRGEYIGLPVGEIDDLITIMQQIKVESEKANQAVMQEETVFVVEKFGRKFYMRKGRVPDNLESATHQELVRMSIYWEISV